MRTRTHPQEDTPTQRLEQAHALLQSGKRDEAREMALRLLALSPGDAKAQALLDRIDNEDYTVAVVHQMENSRDPFEHEDVSPLLPPGLLLIGIVCLLVGTWLAIEPIRMGLAQGFRTEILMDTPFRFLGKGRFPIHFLLLHPVVLYLVAGVSFYAWRRYTRK